MYIYKKKKKKRGNERMINKYFNFFGARFILFLQFFDLIFGSTVIF